MANPLPHDHIIPNDKSEKGKKEQVAEMFDQIAGRYDFMNRFLSMRIDTLWRKKAIRILQQAAPATVLDIATGTGDMAIKAAKAIPTAQITGIDISAQMLEAGKKKIEKEQLTKQIHLELGDSETIKFADNTFEAGMVAFGIRNFENLEQGLSEILRVLKPGAPLIILEFSKPKQPVKALYHFYMGTVAPKLASLFGQSKEAYQYLNESAKAFPERQELVDILNRTGYSETHYQSLSLGICCLYIGKKKR